MANYNIEKDGVVFIDKVKEDVFFSPHILWRIERTRFENLSHSETATLYMFEAYFTLEIKKHNDESIELYLNMIEIPFRSKQIGLAITCGWKGIKGLPVLQQNTRIAASEVVSGKKVKIWGISPLRTDEVNCVFLQESFYFVFSVVPDVSLKGVESEFDLKYERSLECITGLCDDFHRLLYTSERSDVKLQCGYETFSAHATILSSRSEVFAQKLLNHPGIIKISDIEVSIFQEFIRYIYTGTALISSIDAACNLYRAAVNYKVKGLQARCLRSLSTLVQGRGHTDKPSEMKDDCFSALSETHHICKVLLLANEFNVKSLKVCIADCIRKKKYLLESIDWVQFSKENPNLAIEILSLTISRGNL